MIPLFLALALVQTPPDREEIEAMEETARETREISEAREAEADALQREIAELQARLVEAGARVQARELEAGEAEARLETLESEEAALRERLAAERASLAEVLAALQRLELNAPPALAVTPDDASEAARAAGLLSAIAPELERRASALRADIEALTALREELAGQRETVDAAQSALAGVRAEVERLIAERRTAERALREEADNLARQASRMAAEAQSLRQLWEEITQLAEIMPRLSPRRALRAEMMANTALLDGETLLSALPVEAASATPGFGDMRGRLRPPVEGRLSSRAGEPGPDGIRREGLWLEARSGGQVTAPFDGMVVFAGPFQSFDAVIMINTADGYTLILGGIGLLYAEEGQSVLAGEPVGLMPEREIPVPHLYYEVRRGTGNVENPENWLRPEFRGR
ncbi:MAG: murein hydrolase activator EnvC family protein [Caulobacterales bacterium]|uniref:murein hydrolase activator EnvC family protein n=1 Tax=Glycocaulis sp. TaxID=1969725 RepID=UPI003F9F6786